MSAFTRSDWTQIGLLLLCMLPFAATIFLGVANNNPWVVVVATGLAIASAGFSLAWGTESLQFVISQALALGVLAFVNVLPEYSVDVVLAYRGATDPSLLQYATAAMTGANRLLLGVGWPSVFLLSAYASRGSSSKTNGLVLDGHQGLEVLFLGLATVYSFVIAAKGSLGPIDAVVLIALFVSFVFLASRLPSQPDELKEDLEGPSRAVSALKGLPKVLAIAFFVGLGALAIAFGSGPFVTSFLTLTAQLNVGSGGEYLLIQWLTPVLTELPEAVTVFYWAAKTGKGSLALASLVSSKLNQWTILVATIPLVYCVALGGFSSIALTSLQVEELYLTAAQSLFGFVCLLDLRLTRYEISALLLLFAAQFFIPSIRLEVSVAYFVLAGVDLLGTRRVDIFRQVRSSFQGHLH